MHSLGRLVTPHLLLSSWSSGEVTVSTRSPQVLSQATILGRNEGWFVLGKSSVGSPVQYSRRNNLQLPTAAQQVTPKLTHLNRFHFCISWFWESETGEGLGRVISVLHKVLSEVLSQPVGLSWQLHWLCPVPCWGWTGGWTQLGIHHSAGPHPRKPATLRVAGPLCGSSGSRRPRWELSLVSKDKPGTGISSHLPVHISQTTCTKHRPARTPRKECQSLCGHPQPNKTTKIRAASR